MTHGLPRRAAEKPPAVVFSTPASLVARCTAGLLTAVLWAAPLAAQTTDQAEPKVAPPAPQTDVRPAAPPVPKPIPGWVRVSFFANGSSTSGTDGTSSSFSEMVTSLAAQAPKSETRGIDYGLDVRFAGYPGIQGRTNRWSIYNAWVGVQSAGKRYSVRGGQVWLDDLGALGALGGVVAETRRPFPESKSQLRIAGFAGLEPQILQAGYTSGVQKFGGYVAYEVTGKLQRHVVGYVNLRNNGLTERSVLVFSNFLPVQDGTFVYQAAEYDLAGPAGVGSGGLSYFFTNARTRIGKLVEVQGTYHRGRSVDTRAITLDQLNGRPVDAKSLDGFRFESVGGRVTVQVAKGVRVFGGYAVDRNNRGDPQAGRGQFGVWAFNLLGSGLDVNVSDSRTVQSGSTSYDSWYVSVGRRVIARTYLTGEFSSSFSVLRFLGSRSFAIISRPRTRRYGASSTINVTRTGALLVTVERVEDASFTEQRLLSGITYRW